ncbi:MAG: glycosyltransferase family 4 protein [Thermoleophilaceae bacterium]|nr:glycosyltransferase family 4 protein [Thermoleophilaceae bacterium]
MIRQVLSGAGPFDAITSQALAYRELLGGDIHAAAIEPRLKAAVEPLSRLEPGPDDTLLIHYSAYAPKLEPLLELPQRTALVYHNVTPARYLWAHHPHVATLCALGRDHLPRYAQAVDVAIAVSEYNAAELRAAGAREVCVVPVLFDPQRLGPPGEEAPAQPPALLCVGRVVPHKRPDLVKRTFELWRSERAPDARLDMVGEPLSPAYGESLGMPLRGAIAQEELNAAYRGASVFLSLSEHEGFCVPLLEAFHFGVPVVARPVGGMPEVGGDAVLWTDGEDLAVVAELVDLAARDGELRAELARRGRERLREYAPERTAAALREAVA